MKFEELQLSAPILRALKEENYIEPTAIQAKAIPLVLDHQDVLGIAQTGTGKTAAFAMPLIQHLEDMAGQRRGKKKITCLVLTPTRELAIQIGESFDTYGRYCSVTNTVIFGGVPQGAQVKVIREGVDVLIATPGRLLDLMSQGILTLDDVRYFVLDEADRMLDMGFVQDINKVIDKLPDQRQSLFFSATMPPNIEELASKILNDPQTVAVAPVSSTADTIHQFVYMTNKPEKGSLLLHILKNPNLDKVLMFARTKRGADRIVRNLAKKKIKSAAIHGDKAQNQRQRALQQFKDGQIRVLVATDIAARGIDIDKLRYVINYDVPNEPETYVHRIGRCGRAGEEGVALSLCEPEENGYVLDIEKLIGKKISQVANNPFPQTDRPMNEQEKKAFEKEKQRKKQEYFASRKKRR